MSEAPDPFPGEELQFPLVCHFRIITESSEGVEDALRQAIKKLGLKTTLEMGSASETGKYKTFGISPVVNSKEELKNIDKVLRAVPGVRMLL